MAKREFLQLAHVYNPRKHGAGGNWFGKKMDGFRAFSDGGVSRGIPKSEVPWANTAKDYRYKERQIATGLWSKYGNVFHAPDWWLDQMPKIALDGELWNPKLSRQQIQSIVKRIKPGPDWKLIKFYAYDIPPLETIFDSGQINNVHYKKLFDNATIMRWIEQQQFKYDYWPNAQTTFRTVYNRLFHFEEYTSMIPLTQYELPFQTTLAEKQIDYQLMHLLPTEDGLIIRHPDKIWTPERVHHVLKVKDFDDDEATVLGYVTGRETDKGSRLLGMMGAMEVEWKGKIFEISGFTDIERTLTHENYAGADCLEVGGNIAREWAKDNPETKCPEWVVAYNFPRGSIITFKYRGLSDDGIPQEARYWRKA